MKRVLVTGGAGFIGSHLCDALHEAGHHVICLDDLSTGSESNIDQLLGRDRFEFISHNLIHPIALQPERIFHLACPASPVAYQRNPVRTVKANVLGTINVLGMARKTGARVLLASTSEVYGDPKVHPQREDYQGNVNQLGPRACYDEGKRVAETLMMDYHREHGVDIRIARIFNTYGPRMAADDGRVVSNFIIRALGNHPAQLYGGGKQSRSFCYVSDMVEGLVALMDYDGEQRRRPFNLGNPQEITIRELATRIYAMADADAAPNDAPTQQDDPARRCPDITRARTELRFEPRTSLEDGLRRTIDWFRGRA
jgi:UDP-glucuronate decarboxylase